MSQQSSNIPWLNIQSHVQEVIGKTINFLHKSPVNGGDSHSAFHITDKNTEHSLFIKVNHKNYHPVFIAEFDSLHAISLTQSILTPQVICHGRSGQYSYLVMEYLHLSSSGDEYALGQKLAEFHQTSIQKKTPHAFGFDQDNYIGLTLQKNIWTTNWRDFWIEQRLKPQLQLAYQNNFGYELETLQSSLLQASEIILANHFPEASLVHGDLWNGNKAYYEQVPIIFDPASYYADREVDIAMTYLFGGFSNEFYQGYNNTWPLNAGYSQRQTLYNLYHMLNHLNLFGSGYLPRVKQMISQIINLD